MDDLLTRALSVKENIKGMEPLAQLEYVAKLYNDMSASPIKGYQLYLSALSEKLMVKTTPRLSM